MQFCLLHKRFVDKKFGYKTSLDSDCDIFFVKLNPNI